MHGVVAFCLSYGLLKQRDDMNQANVDRAHRIKRGTQKVGHAHDERQSGRDVLKKELEDTKLPAGSICDILIPLQNPKKRAPANVDQRGLDDLIEKSNAQIRAI